MIITGLGRRGIEKGMGVAGVVARLADYGQRLRGRNIVL